MGAIALPDKIVSAETAASVNLCSSFRLEHVSDSLNNYCENK